MKSRTTDVVVLEMELKWGGSGDGVGGLSRQERRSGGTLGGV